jgi:hypothetical protein
MFLVATGSTQPRDYQERNLLKGNTVLSGPVFGLHTYKPTPKADGQQLGMDFTQLSHQLSPHASQTSKGIFLLEAPKDSN